MEFDEKGGDNGHIHRLKKIDEIQEIFIAERGKRNEFSTKYNRGVNIIGVIDNYLGVTAIGLGITGVDSSALIGMEAISIVIGLLRVVGNHGSSRGWLTLAQN